MRQTSRALQRTIGADWTAVILLTISGVAASGLAVLAILIPNHSDLFFIVPLVISLVIALLAVWASKVWVEEAQRRADEQEEVWKLRSELSIAQRARELQHDLVNHLTTVSMLIQMGANDHAVKYLHDILRSSRPAGENVSNTESHTLTLLLGMLGQKFNRAERENISLHIELGAGWDPVNVQDDVAVRLLGNLIDNALDAASKTEDDGESGRVEVSVISERPVVRFRVWNNGPPIPPNILHRIFRQGETSKGGAHRGLGLFIVRQLVDDNGGTIKVESSAENGTEFVVEFPSRVGPSRPADLGSDDAPPLARKRSQK